MSRKLALKSYTERMSFNPEITREDKAMEKIYNENREIIQQEAIPESTPENNNLPKPLEGRDERDKYSLLLADSIYKYKETLEDKKGLLPGYISTINERFPELAEKEEWGQFLKTADQLINDLASMRQNIDEIKKAGDSCRLEKLKDEAEELKDKAKHLLDNLDDAITEEAILFDLSVISMYYHIANLAERTLVLYLRIKGYEELHQDEQHNE